MPSLGAFILAIPGLACLALSLIWWFELPLPEKWTARIVNGSFFLSALVAFLSLGQYASGESLVELGTWYSLGVYRFVGLLAFDPLSLTFAGLAALLLGSIGNFSQSYMHREPGFLRFYLLILMLGVGVEVVLLAGSLDLVFFGWELVGLSSALLIGFFSHRPGPAQGGVRAFLSYRICDIGLLAAVVFMHHSVGNTAFSARQNSWFGLAAVREPETAFLIVALLLMACMGKSALVPFGGWLPRAMEGPTPSSAVFYGALSIHLGPYLMLRATPLIAQTPWAGALLVGIGALTVLHGTLVGRVQSDVKSALAYGSMTQVGLIFMEIGLGFTHLAVLHMIGHACIRTLEILRAPSVLHDYHHIETSLGVVLPRMGLHYERILPKSWQTRLYHLALERGYSEVLVLGFAHWWQKIFGCLDRVEQFLEARVMEMGDSAPNKVEALR